jgi:hypothetical protein
MQSDGSRDGASLLLVNFRVPGVVAVTARLLRRRVRRARAGEASDDVEDRDHNHDRGQDGSPRGRPQPVRAAVAIAASITGGDASHGTHLVFGGPLVAALELVEQHSRVESEVVAVGAEKALGVDRAGQQIPFLVLDRAEVLGADLRLCLDLADVDPLAHPCLAQCRTDIRHMREG